MTQNNRLDLSKGDNLLNAWRKKHDTPQKVADAHRLVLLNRVIQSMAFENESLTLERLRVLVQSQEGN